MNMLLTDISALELWDGAVASAASPTLIRDLGRFAPDFASLQKLDPQSLGLGKPGHLLIPGKGNHPHNANWHCHFWNKPLPPGSIFQISKDAFLASPELCFVQMARRMEFIDVIKLGLELCGFYSTLVPSGHPMRRRPPLTTRDKLAAFVSSTRSATASSTAVRALGYIDDGAESPMESASRILLCLPYRHGCPGFPKPQMNTRIELDSSECRMLRKRFLRCDLYWPLKGAGVNGVALEFKGEEAHSGNENWKSDIARETVLASHGIRVISATYASLATQAGFDALTCALAKELGKRLRFPEGYLVRQNRTRSMVLRGNTCSWLS